MVTNFNDITKEQAYGILAAVATLPEGEAKAILMNLIDEKIQDIIAPTPEKKERRKRNKSGLIQYDLETGKEIARFETIKEANLALGKKPNASSIGDVAAGKGKSAYGFGWKYVEPTSIED